MKKSYASLAAVAQWTECWPANRKTASLIPSQSTCLGCGPDPHLQVCQRQLIGVSFPHFFLPFLSYYKYINLFLKNANKVNLEEMDKFPETFNLSKMKYDDIENLNRRVTSKDIETVIKNLPVNKSPGPDSFINQIFK